LLAELMLEGRVVQEDGAPFAFSVAPTGDHILDTVARTVEKRPRVPWWRWFRHVRDDRLALTEELVTAGRWVPRGGVRRAWDDVDDTEAQALAYDLHRVVTKEIAPKDARQATLAIIAAMCGAVGGRPRPRALRTDLKPLLTAAVATGEPGTQWLPSMLVGASRLSRRPMRR